MRDEALETGAVALKPPAFVAAARDSIVSGRWPPHSPAGLMLPV